MSANKVKKVKMATKSCPECDQQVSVYFISADINIIPSGSVPDVERKFVHAEVAAFILQH